MNSTTRTSDLETENAVLRARAASLSKQTNAAHAVMPFAILANIKRFTGGSLQILSNDNLELLFKQTCNEMHRRHTNEETLRIERINRVKVGDWVQRRTSWGCEIYKVAKVNAKSVTVHSKCLCCAKRVRYTGSPRMDHETQAAPENMRLVWRNVKRVVPIEEINSKRVAIAAKCDGTSPHQYLVFDRIIDCPHGNILLEYHHHSYSINKKCMLMSNYDMLTRV